MKKTAKILGLIIISLGIILIGGNLFLKTYFSSENIKKYLLPYLEKTLGRKITVEHISLSLFRGIELKKIQIHDNPVFRSAPFLTADELVLRYSLLPLLKKQLIIHKVILHQPKIFIERDEQGLFNFSDLLPSSQSSDQSPSDSPQPPPLSENPPLILTISEIKVKDGQVTFSDRSKPSLSPIIFENLLITASDISLTKPFRLNCATIIKDAKTEAQITIEGQIDLSSSGADLQAEINNLDIIKFSPYFQEVIPFQLLSSRLDLKIHTQKKGSEVLTSQGNLSLHEITINNPALSSQNPQPITPIQVSYELVADLLQKSAQVQQLKLTALEIPINLQGQITHFDTEAINLKLLATAEKIDLAKIQKNLRPLFVTNILKKLTLSGQVSHLLFKLDGSPRSNVPLFYSGQAELAQVKINYLPFPSFIPLFSGTLELDPEKVLITKADLQLFESHTQISGSIKNYLKEPEIDLVLSSIIPNLASIYKAIPSQEYPWVEKLFLQGSADLSAHLTGDPAKPANLRYSGQAKLHQVNFQTTYLGSLSPQLKGDISFTEKEILINQLLSTVAQSDFILKGRIKDYTQKPIVYADLSSKKLNLDELLKGFQSQQESLSKQDKLNQTTPEEDSNSTFLADLTATGSLQISQLDYKKVNLSQVMMNYSLKNNILQSENLRCKIDKGGLMNVNGRLDLQKMRYASKIILDSFPVQELFSFTWPKLAPFFSGSLTSHINIEGEGTDKEVLQKNLNLEGNLELTKGQIKNTVLGKEVSNFLGVPSLTNLQFDHLTGHVKVEKGLVKISTQLANDNYILQPEGTISLDGLVNLSLLTKFSPNLTKGNKLLTQGLADNKGWVNIPLKVRGTIHKPLLELDQKTIKEEAGKKIKEKILQELFPDKNQKKNNKKLPPLTNDYLKEKLKGLFK